MILDDDLLPVVLPPGMCPCGMSCPDGRNYYVSVVDGSRFALLLGPFPKHAWALAWVEPVRAWAEAADPRGHFYGFGTCVSTRTEPGRLNGALGLTGSTLFENDPLLFGDAELPSVQTSTER